MKEKKFGVWIPCLEGKMPEDILGYKDMGGWDITPTVLIPHFWGNEHGGGEFYPAQRIRKNGNKSWQWYNCTTAKPLFWMIIPVIPTKAGVAVYKKILENGMEEKVFGKSNK